jgi:hypothetical protein
MSNNAIKWAEDITDKNTLSNYNKIGKKLVAGEDKVSKSGITWIDNPLDFEDSADKTQTVIRSPSMRTPTNFMIHKFSGKHYCKLLTPYRALEWIYFDSLIDYSKKVNGMTKTTSQS